jgi:hypothetical protein
VTQDNAVSRSRCLRQQHLEEWRRARALFGQPEERRRDVVRRYLPVAAVLLLIALAAVLGGGPFWP